MAEFRLEVDKMFLEKMNYLDVEKYLKTRDTVVIPVGSIENHGKHMPLGTDTMIPHRIAAFSYTHLPLPTIYTV